jgi:hypothetical protein
MGLLDGLSTLRERAGDLLGGPPDAARRPRREQSGGRREGPGDGPDGDTMWDRVSEASTVAPVHGDPTLEPADQPWEVAMLAGWGDPEGEGRGADALNGPGRMVTGELDAREEMGLGYDGEPGPLEVDPRATLDARIDAREQLGYERRDWTTHL